MTDKMDTAAAIIPHLIDETRDNFGSEERKKFHVLDDLSIISKPQQEYNDNLDFESAEVQHEFHSHIDQEIGSELEEVQDEFEDQRLESEPGDEQNEFDDLDQDTGSETDGTQNEFDDLEDQDMGSQLEELQHKFNCENQDSQLDPGNVEDQYGDCDDQSIESEQELGEESGNQNIKSEQEIIPANENSDDQSATNSVPASSSLLDEFMDLKNRLPRTVLEECVVELASMKKCQDVPKSGRDAIIIIPTYRKRTPSANNIAACMSDVLSEVEVVYSDEDEPGTRVTSNNPSSSECYGSPPPYDFLKKKSKKHFLSKMNSPNLNYSIQGGEKLYKCPICNRKFHRNCSLALHMKCHTDQKKCACKVCGKEFLRVSMLIKHKKVHRGLYSNTSSASFVGKKHSEQDGRILTDDQSIRFSCKLCDVTFKTKQLLELHFHLTHKRAETPIPFSCKLCRASFATVQQLNEHSTCHAGSDLGRRDKLRVVEKLSCNICKVNFTYRTALLKHYKKIHQVDIMDLDMDTAAALLHPQYHQVLV